jgi:hypothetical protein
LEYSKKYRPSVALVRAWIGRAGGRFVLEDKTVFAEGNGTAKRDLSRIYSQRDFFSRPDRAQCNRFLRCQRRLYWTESRGTGGSKGTPLVGFQGEAINDFGTFFIKSTHLRWVCRFGFVVSSASARAKSCRLRSHTCGEHADLTL